MKIGIYSPYLDTLTGGEKYIFTIASCLSKDHNVNLFWDDPDILEKASLKFALDLKNVNVEKNIFSSPNLLFKIIKTLDFDRIIYLSDGSVPIVGSKKLFIHFQFPVEWLNTNSVFFKLKKRLISKIICNSHFTKEFIDRKFGMSSFVLYPPSDISKKYVREKKNVILTVGRFSELSDGSDFKKISELVKAFKIFQKKRLKGWIFRIITSVNPQDEEKFRTFERRIKSSSVELIRNASFEEIQNAYRDSKIYWHAAGYGENLAKHPELAEHFGISTVEAMSFGSVPIVINAGGQKEIVRHFDNGFLWNNLEELVEFTHKIATDNDLRKKISERAFESSQNFSKERFCNDLKQIIW